MSGRPSQSRRFAVTALPKGEPGALRAVRQILICAAGLIVSVLISGFGPPDQPVFLFRVHFPVGQVQNKTLAAVDEGGVPVLPDPLHSAVAQVYMPVDRSQV